MGTCTCPLSGSMRAKLISRAVSYVIIGGLLMGISSAEISTSAASEMMKGLATTKPTPPMDFYGELEVFGRPEPIIQAPAPMEWNNGTVCRPGPRDRNTFKYGNDVEDLRGLENCTIVEGNLQIIWLYRFISPHNYTNVQFPKLVEITGYLMLYRVDGLQTLGQLFPNLRVIRGLEDFFSHALILYENADLMSISLPRLSYVGEKVLAMSNPQLCFVDDHVSWNSITPRGLGPTVNGNRAKRGGCDLVDGCPDGCSNCWDMDTCQIDCNQLVEFEGKSHNPGCTDDGRHCHDQCMGGCKKPNSVKDCYVCRKIFYEDTCLEKCPEKNKHGEELFEYEGRWCITRDQCVRYFHFNKFHDGKCLKNCPKGYADHKELTDLTPLHDYSLRVCVRCKGTCDKVCNTAVIQTASDTDDVAGCTIIQGMLEIIISNSPGNLTLLNENLQQITEVTEYVKVVRSRYLKNLKFLRNLKIIRGLKLDQNKYAFYVMNNDNLEELWDFDEENPLRIERGMMFFQRNPYLCPTLIDQLLNSTVFEGQLLLEDNTLQNISTSTHNEFDISHENNGRDGNCYKNSLFFEIYHAPPLFFPNFNFSEFKTADERTIISYVIYYREVGLNDTATYYKSDCDSNLTDWQTLEVEKTEETTLQGSTRYYDGYIPDMNPFTRYAAYVETYLTRVIPSDGARSKIIYFTTKPAKPTRPRDLVVNADSMDGMNVGLIVSWLPPESPNGIIEYYNVYYRMVPWNVEHVWRKDHCQRQSDTERSDDPPPEEISPLTTDAPPSAKCECSDGSSDKKTLVKDSERDNTVVFRYMFENTMQNVVFQKNPDILRELDSINSNMFELGLHKATKKPAAEFVGNVSVGVNASQTLSHEVSFGNVTHSTKVNVTMTNSAEVEVTDSTSTTVSTVTTVDTPPAVKNNIQIPSMVSVQANQTSIGIYDLEPKMEYSIEVVACHAYNKTENKTRCSKRSVATATTKPDPSLDRIDSSTIRIKGVEGENGKVAFLNFSWDLPEKTNGPILTYTIAYRAVSDSGATSTSNSTNEENIFCVQAKEFAANNNSYVWDVSHLNAGSKYAFKVSMRTVGTPFSEYTEEKLFKVGEADNDNVMVIAVPTVVVGVVVLGMVVAFLVYRTNRKKPLPLTTLHNSFNIDYMDTENIYIPDEWELDRAKVKIGISLGQGSFGMVYEGEAKDLYNTDKKPRKVAIKTVNDTATIQDRINFLNEASRMKAFKCHHIVQLLGVVSQGQPVLVIMELMGLGDLKNYLRMHRPDEPDNDGRRPPTLREILQMAAEIADGMAYLSDKKFVHRDLAARNCMVAQDMTVKIGDFGMTRDVYGADYYRKGGKGMLPVRWMAPESLRDGVYTSKSDVWSYGVVLWEMATLAAQPYQGFSNEEVLKFVVDSRVMEMPDGCPSRLFEMMRQCWQYYPRYRPSFANLLESLQGDVKKTFFSVSWYYSERDDDESDMESDSLNIEDQSSESQRLHPSSIHSASTDQNLDADLDIEDDMESGSEHAKDLMMGEAPPVPMRMGMVNSDGSDRYVTMENGLHHGLAAANDSLETEEEYDSPSMSASPLLSNGDARGARINCESRSMAPSSIISTGQPPPSYNTATQDRCMTDPSLWSVDTGSKGNSCNGSANGHIHYGTNTLTSAC